MLRFHSTFNIFLGILQYQIPGKNTFLAEGTLTKEFLVKKFVWAQWDPNLQTLYYIHHRKRNRCLVEGDENVDENDSKVTPTLSGLQFNDELPHETVVKKKYGKKTYFHSLFCFR